MEIFSQTSILFWLVAIVILLIMEIISLGLTTIWFAGGALVAFILAVFNVPVLIQVFVFLVVSLLLLIFTRPIAVKYFNKDRARTNVESMIGKQAIVLSEIDNVQGTGRVTVSGQEWSAKTMVDDIKLPVGAVVIIKDVKGVKLIVEERKEEN